MQATYFWIVTAKDFVLIKFDAFQFLVALNMKHFVRAILWGKILLRRWWARGLHSFLHRKDLRSLRATPQNCSFYSHVLSVLCSLKMSRWMLTKIKQQQVFFHSKRPALIFFSHEHLRELGEMKLRYLSKDDWSFGWLFSPSPLYSNKFGIRFDLTGEGSTYNAIRNMRGHST